MFKTEIKFNLNLAGCGIAFNQTKYFERGQWTHVKQYVKMNTVGKKDGILKAWINGQMKANYTKMIYRTRATLGIDSFVVHTFFGGSGYDWVTSTSIINFNSFKY